MYIYMYTVYLYIYPITMVINPVIQEEYIHQKINRTGALS